MASLFKKRTQNGYSPYWFAAYTDAKGARRQKTTKLTDRKLALRLANEWEKLAEKALAGVLTEAACREVVSEIHEQVTGRPVIFHTVTTCLNAWLETCVGATAPRTMEKYRGTVAGFLKFLGTARSGRALPTLSESEIREFRDYMIDKGKSASTVNQEIKILRAPFKWAMQLGYIPINPAVSVKPLQDSQDGQKTRDAFTIEQVQKLLRAAVDSDWQGMILVGVHCGLRLGDAVNLTWNAVDMETGVLSLLTGKRKVRVVIPIHPELRDWLSDRVRGTGAATVFPSLYGKSGSGKSGLSMAFKSIMEKAGVKGEVVRTGRGRGRTTSSLSFHSTRHYYVSALSARGVDKDVRKRLSAHTDDKSHAVYSGHEVQSLQDAISKLPRISCEVIG